MIPRITPGRKLKPRKALPHVAVTGTHSRGSPFRAVLTLPLAARMTFWKQYIVLYGGFHDTGVKSMGLVQLQFSLVVAYFLLNPARSELPF